MIWTLLPFGMILLLIAGVLLTNAFGAGLLHLLYQAEAPDTRKQEVRLRREATDIADLIIYRGLPLRKAG